MPSIKPLPYSVALAVAALAHSGYGMAASSSSLPNNQIWNCAAAADGSWKCGTVPAPRSTLGPAAGQSSSVAEPLATDAKSLSRYRSLDWVQQTQRDQVCQGSYVEPQFKVHGDEAEANPPVYLDAGSSKAELGGLTSLREGVNLRQGIRRLSSEEADIDQGNNSAHFRTDVVYREPGVLVTSDDAKISLSEHKATFKNAEFVLHQEHLRGQAEAIERHSNDTVDLKEGTYTFCPPGNEDWMLSADNIKLDQETGFGVARNATLKVGPVPIFYAPYLSFPIDDRRQSGFLYPKISYAQINGADISVPYYFNLAPNYDNTLTPRWIGERGAMLENEFRYLNERSRNRFALAYLPDDKLAGKDRWLTNVTHTGTPWTGWQSRIDYTSVSDDAYFDDLGTSLQVERESNLDRIGELRYYTDNWNVLARMHSYQTLVTGTQPYRRLPQVQLNGDYDLNFTSLSYQAEYVFFDRDKKGLTGSDRITGNRVHFAPAFSKRFSNSWGYITPGVRLWTTQYELNNQLANADETPAYNVPIVSLDSGLIFERELQDGITQTLEPRLFMLYVPDEDQSDAPNFDTALLDFDYRSLFRYNRFSGRDRIGDAQQISLGLTSRYLENDGFERARFSIGQAYYMDDRDVVLSGNPETSGQSNIAMEAVWNYNRHLRITVDNVLAYSDLDMQEANIRLNYKSDADRRFNFSYRFEENVRDQADLHFIWPLSTQWTALGRWQHNLEDREDLETVLGIEYESCCWKLQLTGRRWLSSTDEYNNGIFLRFVLKGLGSLSSSKTGFLNDITGFEERDEQDEY